MSEGRAEVSKQVLELFNFDIDLLQYSQFKLCNLEKSN